MLNVRRFMAKLEHRPDGGTTGAYTRMHKSRCAHMRGFVGLILESALMEGHWSWHVRSGDAALQDCC